ncbi:3-O-acetylpapaveroxine carboxylesterase CXE2 [Euphorbia peplus]|nr:3-O-acetylpapaveroxine carboxylesterase CXE2 [Euphorbia peplus]
MKIDDGKYPTLDATDIIRELCLPVGSDRDHEYNNPMSSVDSSSKWEAGFQVLEIGFYGNRLIDREMELTKMLEENGAMIVTHFDEGSHADNLVNLSKAELTCYIVKDFIP